MGKIWLKNVDPSKQYCGCDGKNGPCDSCCIITGNFTDVIKDTYDGIVYDLNSGCISASYLSDFTTPTGFENNIHRKFSYVINSPIIGANFFNVYEDKIVSVANMSYQSPDNVASPYNNIDLDYTLSFSSNDGLHFASANSFQTLYSSPCQLNIARQFKTSWLSQFNFNSQSGDTITLYAKGLYSQSCSNRIYFQTNPDGVPSYFAEGSCGAAYFIVSTTITPKKYTDDNWLYITGIYIGTTKAFPSKISRIVNGHQIFGPNKYDLNGINNWCNTNTHPVTGISGPCHAIPSQNLQLYCAANNISPCCGNQDVDYSNPIYGTTDGTIQFTFVKSKCVQFDFPRYCEVRFKIQDSRGRLIDPLTRIPTLYINTGIYRACNELP